MDDPQVPNLEEMDEQEASHLLTELLPKLSPEEEYELRHEDYVMEMSQSGELIRSMSRMLWVWLSYCFEVEGVHRKVAL